ncbi:unnamed protein product [Blepharisma stoltei]|uniref:poly(A)-specific ribonuclease n=1 Tax=Blepharisma stoltei TaxID=1481888 RepID=A0AAU9JT56_9CILI|nr:unnamed protein product [Blepharisma stoltei]
MNSNKEKNNSHKRVHKKLQSKRQQIKTQIFNLKWLYDFNNKIYFTKMLNVNMSLLNPSTPAFEPLSFKFIPPQQNESMIKNVWKHNLKSEILIISNLLENYPYVAMDTEFPGIIVKAQGELRDIQYQNIRHNVDRLKLIQVGITLSDGQGNFPSGICTWQFNFDFDLSSDAYSEDSIQLLRQSGIDFDKHATDGISHFEFAEFFTVSGLCLNEDISYLTFHSGYDFAYLLKTVTNQKLPETQDEFYKQLSLYFPVFFDIKFMVQGIDKYRGGLSRIAEEVGVRRFGRMHQAGSDSLVTLETFFTIKNEEFSEVSLEKYANTICGLAPNSQNQEFSPSFAR